MSDVTELLERWSLGDSEAFKEADTPLVYEELHKWWPDHLRHERVGHLETTALVHEAYLRLSGVREMRLQNCTRISMVRAHTSCDACSSIMRGAGTRRNAGAETRRHRLLRPSTTRSICGWIWWRSTGAEMTDRLAPRG